MTEETDTLGTLRTFIAAGAGLANVQVLMQYPDAKHAEGKDALVRLELTEVVPTDWVGTRGPNTSPGGGLVDMTRQHLYVVRIEAWGRKKDNPAGKSDQQFAIETMTLVRQRLDRFKNGLLKDTGLHYQDTGRQRALPHDPNYPDWSKVAVWFSGYKDEAWTQAETA